MSLNFTYVRITFIMLETWYGEMFCYEIIEKNVKVNIIGTSENCGIN